MTGRLEAKVKKGKLLALGLTINLFGALFLWAGIAIGEEPWLFFGGALFFLLIGTVCPALAIAKNTTIVFDRYGIDGKNWKHGVIPWSDIKAVWIFELNMKIQQTFLCLKFKNPNKYPPQYGKLGKLLRYPEQHMDLGDFQIRLDSMTANVYDAYMFIQQLQDDKLIDVEMRSTLDDEEE